MTNSLQCFLNHLIFTGADFAIVSSTYFLPSAPDVEPTKLLAPTPSQRSREVASEGGLVIKLFYQPRSGMVFRRVEFFGSSGHLAPALFDCLVLGKP